jgi:DNA-binding NarL/FixJ family response regulator
VAEPVVPGDSARGHTARAPLHAGRSEADVLAGPPAAAATAVPEGDGLGLTPREREVLEHIALGQTNRQIADDLFISVKTAGVHVSHILEKLGVATRGEAAAVARRLGLVA